MAHQITSLPNHLSIFVSDPETGRPVQRLPIYVEVAVPKIIPTPPINSFFHEIVYSTASDFTSSNGNKDYIAKVAWESFTGTIEGVGTNQLILDDSQLREFFYQVFKQALDATGQSSLAGIPASDLKTEFVAAIRRLAPEFGLRLIAKSEKAEAIWTDPLGVLTTDHVGYVSYDLRRLRPDVQVALAEAIEKRRADADAELNIGIWVYLYGNPEKFDVLQQARFAADAVVARLSMIWRTLPPALINMGPRALQNPSLTDWRLSPASFAASPKSLLGADGCEEMLPANLALQEFVLRQVVRLTDAPSDFNLPPGFKAAYVDDYKVSWFSLGHSLGEILYSLPLAPGETVKLAVIDWSWDSLTNRDETTKLTEDILHRTHRDRTITETVKSGLKELQRGSSFMGGMANAVGGSGGANLGVVGIGAAAGNTWSFGGSTATTSGSRDLVAENVQRVNDSFAQASSSQREINSTVVVQARQEEKESIQTRTFSNYNHSHTLTILYYEVLRHYRVTVEWVRRRQAVLVKVPARVAEFDAATIINNRFLLEPNLVDLTLKPAFDFLEKQEAIREHQVLHGITPSDDWIGQHWDGNLEFHMFQIGIWTTPDTATSDSEVVAYIITADQGLNEKKYELRYVYKGGHMGKDKNNVHNLNSGPRFNTDDAEAGVWTFVKPFNVDAGEFVSLKWKEIAGFQFEKWGDNDWRITYLQIDAFGLDGLFQPLTTPEVRRDVDLYFAGFEPSSQTFTWINRPPEPPALLPPLHRKPEKQLTLEEHHLVRKLFDHFKHNKDYYNQLLIMSTDPTSITIEMETIPWGPGQFIADHVDPTPLEIFGSYVAYPLAKQKSEVNDVAAALSGNDPIRREWAVDKLASMNEVDRQSVLDLTSSKSERLITLPTRGVFAEGKLGHCNISEEIDNTRFWKWDEHPIPIQATDINPITAITPQPQQVTATPTPFPQSLVNIVNPSAAPDPSGLASALSLLGTPNIFRDMSGRQEVADLLKKLTEESVNIAEVANKARELQSKYGTDLDKNQKELDAKTIEASTQAQIAQSNAQAKKAEADAQKSQSEAKKVDLETDQAKLKAAQDHLTPAEQKPVRKEIAKKWSTPTPPKKKEIQFNLKGWGDTNLVGQWRLDLDQRGTAVAFVIETATNASGIVKMEVPNEFGDNRYSLSIAGEILSGFGINSILKVRNLLVEFPADKYKANDYLYVMLKATTDKFHTKASNSDEATKKFSEHLGVSPEIGYKDIIKVTGEGGWTWEREGKKVADYEMEMDVYYYTGGFTVDSIS